MIVECNNGRCKLSDNWPHLVKIGEFLDVFSGVLLQSEAKRPRSDRYGPASPQHHPRLLECVKCTSFPCLRECNDNNHLGFNPVFTSGTAMHDVWIAYTNTRNIAKHRVFGMPVVQRWLLIMPLNKYSTEKEHRVRWWLECRRGFSQQTWGSVM